MLPLTKKYLKFCFSYFLEQIITSPTRPTNRTETLIEQVLKNSSHKVSHLRVIDLGLSDHDLLLCTRKTLKPKSHKNSKRFFWSLKRYKILRKG